jgi:hypothetical protein
LDDLPRIRKIPAVIVQGRYDFICPMRSAWDLHRAWPQADFQIVDDADAGHSAFERGTMRALVRLRIASHPSDRCNHLFRQYHSKPSRCEQPGRESRDASYPGK